MKAEDTVMDYNYRVMIGLKDKSLEENLEAQAEISFKAGQQNGLSLEMQGEAYCMGVMAAIREVVEWMNENNSCPVNSYYGMKIIKEEWHAKLKEWGIE